MINYWLMAFKKYATFTGRARRSEYWYFALMNFLITLVLYVLVFVSAAAGSGLFAMIFGALIFIYMLGSIVPSLAVLVRCLHDSGKSGWYYFVSLIPLAGPIWLLVLLATDSTPGDNEYGPNPKALENN
ncbi:MAG: DUF805 domain-containing protein [Bacteroidetes bacterium]|nr:DUF805 domain-containing protein [Bacteroidota bacterium]